VLLAGLVGHHTWTAFALILVLIFAMFFTAPVSYALMSFFVTAMLGLLYTLLHTYSLSVLVLRIDGSRRPRSAPPAASSRPSSCCRSAPTSTPTSSW
jgi:hypothetical protein